MKRRSTREKSRFVVDIKAPAFWVCTFYLLIGLIGSWRVGAYADSPADALLAKYNFGLLFGLSDLTANYPLDWDVYVASYGYSVALFVFGPIWFVGKLFDPNFSLQSENAIFLRNFLSYSIGMLGILALYKWGRIVLKPGLQFLPLLLPILTPTLFGNFFMNSKDIPLFTGFSSLMYLIALLFDKVETIKVKSTEIVFWVFVSVVFTFGVRPISIAWLIPIFAVIIIFVFKQKDTYLRPIFIGLCISIAYTWITNYYLLTNPLFWISNLLNTGKDFPWTGAVLSWGKLYRAPEIPGSYLSEMLFAQIPLFVILIIPVYIFRIRSKSKNNKSKLPFSVIASFALSLFVILQTLVLKPVIYDNGRQLLFVWGLLALVLMWLINESYSTIKKFKSIATVLACLTIVATIDQIKLFPYNYVYRNEIAQKLPAGSFETDYWGLSGKELARWVVKDSSLSNIPNAKFAYIFQQSYDPFLKKSGLELVSINDLGTKYYSQIWRPGLLPDYSAQCPIAYSVERSFLLGKKEVLGYVRKCE